MSEVTPNTCIYYIKEEYVEGGYLVEYAAHVLHCHEEAPPKRVQNGDLSK